MKEACPFLGFVFVALSTGVWALPGKSEIGTTSLIALTALKTHPLHGIRTVYETVCNQTGLNAPTHSRVSTSASCHDSSTVVSANSETAAFPSHVQSRSSHQESGQSISWNISTGLNYLDTSAAQSAFSTLISGQSDIYSSPPPQNTSQRSTEQSSSSWNSTPRTFIGQESNLPTSKSQQLTSETPNSTPSMSSILIRESTSTTFSTASSFSFSVPSGYTLVKLSTSSSTESVPNGWSLEALSTLNPSSNRFNASSTTQSSSKATLTGQGNIKISALPRPNSSSLFPATSIPTSSIAYASTSRSYSSTRNSSSLSSASIPRPSLSTPANQILVPLSSAPTAPRSSASFVASNASLATDAAVSNASVSSTLAASALSIASAAFAAPASKVAASETAIPPDCNDGTWDLTVANYLKANTDANLKTWWHGGTDNETGVTFSAKTAPGTFFTEALAGSFEPVGSEFVCTLESHSCQPADGCANYAVHLPQGISQTGPASFFNKIGPASHYGWFAIHSIANIFSFSETFTSGLTSAGIQIASENLQLTQTFTKPVDQHIAMRAILLGVSLLIAILFAFIPIVGELASATITAGVVAGVAAIGSTAISTTASFIGVSLVNGPSLDTKAATFGAYMGLTFNNTASAIDQLVSKLMNGDALNGTPGVTDPSLFNVLDGGLWVNSSVITNPSLSISAMTELMRDDLTSRGINYIWSQSKIYVTFANLNDDAAGTKCQADKNGWQASKTCADGGVYYLYRFNEHGNLNGNLDYPWGADKMIDSPFNLQPNWVTAGSAASYRAQNGGIGGFEYDQTTAPANLTNLLTEVGKTGTLNGLRTMPGVWNISVCDMGMHNDWNADFTQKPMVTENKDNLPFFFPCCCGPNCLQTHDFVKSAQMENFKTIYDTCWTQLQPCNAWPPGVVSIDFGDAGVITNGSCINEDRVPPAPEPFSGPF